MTDTITLTGLVATSPRHIVTSEGLAITSFRLASNQRRFDRTQNAWVDGDTNWYTITAFRQLGTHVASSVEKGQRVIVTGRVRIRDWESGEKAGTTIEIDAETIGHDLMWGRSSFTRSVISASHDTGGEERAEHAEHAEHADQEGHSDQPGGREHDERGEDESSAQKSDGTALAGASSTPF